MGTAPEGFPSSRMEVLMSPKARTHGLLGGGFSARCLGWMGKASPERMPGGDSGGEKLLERSLHVRGVGFTSLSSSPLAALLLSAGFPAWLILMALLTK